MKYIVYSLTVVLLFSCVSDDFSVGDSLVSVKGRSIVTDTCTVELFTQLSDSSVTSGISRILEGRYISNDFGTITSHAYFDFDPPSYSSSDFTNELKDYIKFDSVSLVLRYDQFSYGDTTRTQTVQIYKLKENLLLDDGEQLYTTSSFKTEETPWITHTFNRPTELSTNDSTLLLRLPDEFGLELISMMQGLSDTLDTYINFQKYFKGLKLSPGADDNTCINTFIMDDEYPVIRIHYTNLETGIEEKEFDIQVHTSTAFSQIETDWSNTLLSSLNRTNKSVSSVETENKLFVQGLTGLYTRLSFPHINNLLSIADYVQINYAYLYIYPTLGTYNDYTSLPSYLDLKYLDENGNPLDIYIAESARTVYTGQLTEDKLFNKDTYYAFDVSDYLIDEFGKFGIHRQHLQIQLLDSVQSTTLSSVVYGDSFYSDLERRIKLVINYIVYDND